MKCWSLYMKVICDNRYFLIGINKTIE
ncbi:LuxR family transcriptional regulator, partial [Escherichia coli]|nr:LuxR family transcriptional regulator [Escherichia coli]